MNRNGRVNEKQRKLAKIMVNGDYQTKGDAVEKAGYAPSVAKVPAQPLGAKGFLQCVVEEATKVGNIIDGMSAQIALNGYQDYPTHKLVDMIKTLSEAQKNIMQSLPQQKKKEDTTYIIDLD